MKLVLFQFILILFASFGLPAAQDVKITVYGKTYKVSNVTTVQDVYSMLQNELGVDPSQTTLCHGWKRYHNDDGNQLLSGAGARKGAHWTIMSKNRTVSKISDTIVDRPENPITIEKVEEMMNAIGIDTKKLEQEIKRIVDQSDMRERLQRWSTMIHDPTFRASVKDPRKLEQMRQMIVHHRTVKDFKSKIMKMNNVLDDPNEWQKAMTEAADLFFNVVDDEHFKVAWGGGHPGKYKAWIICPRRMIRRSCSFITDTDWPNNR